MNRTAAKVPKEAAGKESVALTRVSIVIGLARLQNVAARLRLSMEEKKDRMKESGKESE